MAGAEAMLSYAKGPLQPLLDRTIGEQLAESARLFPDRTALVSRHQRERYTWAELDAATRRWAGALRGLGLEKGDRVGVWSTTCADWVLLQLACARAGLVLVNVNPAYRSHELSFVLRKSGMKAIFYWSEDARANYQQILDEACASENSLMHSMVFRSERWQTMLSAAQPFAEPGSADAVVNIQYTSGTTGSPKGVLLTHRNLVNNAHIAAQQLRFSGDDVLCSPVPLYHCFGCVLAVLVCVCSGARLVLPHWTYDARATLESIHEERATAIYGVPTMFIAELEHPDFARFDLTSLRTGIMAGAPCPIEVMKRVIKDMHCTEMTIGYGLTETSPLITMTAAGDPLDVRVGTVGSATANAEVRVVGPDGQSLPAGEQGELWARGYMVMQGYDGEPEATARAIDKEGWFHTGDLGVMRPDGHFRITGRAKDMIIRGGENIYPREIEEFLYEHPAVADVQVVGLPDARLGETTCAWIRLRVGAALTDKELRSWCRGKIAHFKVPQHIRFVDQFPMTVTGKIQKFRIREVEIERLGLQKAAKIETA